MYVHKRGAKCDRCELSEVEIIYLENKKIILSVRDYS